MEGFLLFIPVLACPIGMALMMWSMARWMRPSRDSRAAVPGVRRREQHGASATLEGQRGSASLVQANPVRFAQHMKEPAEMQTGGGVVD
jgi:hypothetical protein